jgi:hypothetical protein
METRRTRNPPRWPHTRRCSTPIDSFARGRSGGERRLERRQVAVDVGDDGDPCIGHLCAMTMSPSTTPVFDHRSDA